MPFTFHADLQRPHKHSHSLQLAIHTQLGPHYIRYDGIWGLFSKYHMATSKYWNGTWNGH